MATNRIKAKKAAAKSHAQVASAKVERQVEKLLGDVSDPLYSLAEIGEQTGKLPLSPAVIMESINGLNRTAREALTQASEALPKAHKAQRSIAGALAALDSLKMFAQVIWEFMPERDLAKTMRAMIGHVILFHTGWAGREMERAEQAVGGSPTCGYLDGYLLDGDDDMRHIVRDSEQEKLLFYFNTTNPGGQRQILAMAQAVKEQSPKGAQ